MFPYAISDQKYNDYIKETFVRLPNLLKWLTAVRKQKPHQSGIFAKEQRCRKCGLVTHLEDVLLAETLGTIPTSLLN
jgi:hypothetical protein